MADGSFSSGSLGDLGRKTVRRMLELDESLFVEHKRGLNRDSAYQVAVAVAAFANTAGGWLLIGVEKGKVVSDEALWTGDAPSVTLVDQVRDHLRERLDPLPAFEAKVFDLPDGPVGVVRVYESADTPHVMIETGAVFVREVAGVSDTAAPKRSGSGARADRKYEAVKIGSRAQLLELSARGRRADERTVALLDLRQPLPMTTEALGLSDELVHHRTGVPKSHEMGRIFVRLAPNTLPPHFRGWSTTASAAAAVIEAAEQLSGLRGLGPSWATPHPAGVAVEIDATPAKRHYDGAGLSLAAIARVVHDGIGVVGAALELAPPGLDAGRRAGRRVEELIGPVINAALHVLGRGEFIGRARCQIDLVDLPKAVATEPPTNGEASGWVPFTAELVLPATPASVRRAALLAANAYARSAGLPMWDAFADDEETAGDDLTTEAAGD